MPEGDTLFRTAATLERAVAGRTVTRFDVRRVVAHERPSAGWVVDAVEARGKHLLVHFDHPDHTPLTLRTHLKMTGSWHVYRPHERWRKPPRRARAEIWTDVAVAVCFSAPVVEIIPTGRLDRHRELSRLGPDLTDDDADLDEALRRLARHATTDTPAGVALLDQRIACGVGNVYKSEVLHACRVHPATPVGDLRTDVRRDLFETASRLLRANLAGYPRRTVPEGLAVYGRAGSRCRTCGTAVVSSHQGDQARVTFWCPTCQPASSEPD